MMIDYNRKDRRSIMSNFDKSAINQAELNRFIENKLHKSVYSVAKAESLDERIILNRWQAGIRSLDKLIEHVKMTYPLNLESYLELHYLSRLHNVDFQSVLSKINETNINDVSKLFHKARFPISYKNIDYYGISSFARAIHVSIDHANQILDELIIINDETIDEKIKELHDKNDRRAKTVVINGQLFKSYAEACKALNLQYPRFKIGIQKHLSDDELINFSKKRDNSVVIDNKKYSSIKVAADLLCLPPDIRQKYICQNKNGKVVFNTNE